VKFSSHFIQNYHNQLNKYITQLKAGASKAQLKRIQEGIQNAPHPTVWQDMIRQRSLLADLKTLFDQAPEVITF
jgi:hypothetical protein